MTEHQVYVVELRRWAEVEGHVAFKTREAAQVLVDEVERTEQRDEPGWCRATMCGFHACSAEFARALDLDNMSHPGEGRQFNSLDDLYSTRPYGTL
jgi:hypothetical protein